MRLQACRFTKKRHSHKYVHGNFSKFSKLSFCVISGKKHIFKQYTRIVVTWMFLIDLRLRLLSCNLYARNFTKKKDSVVGVFLNILRIFQSEYIYKHLWATAWALRFPGIFFGFPQTISHYQNLVVTLTNKDFKLIISPVFHVQCQNSMWQQLPETAICKVCSKLLWLLRSLWSRQ